MSRFIIPVNPKKRRRQELWDYFLVMVVVPLTILAFILDSDRDNKKHWFGTYYPIFFLLFFGIPAFNRLVRKKDEYYVDVNDDQVEFEIPEYDDKGRIVVNIPWKDIRWIRQENDFTISIFQDSSIRARLPLRNFLKDDQERILQEIRSIAENRQIRLVNFSELRVWVD